jgi:hypothetical protein
MSKVSEIYGGRYLNAANVPVIPQEWQIESVVMDTKLGKIAIALEGSGKEVMLNKTNALMIAEVLGDDSDDWPGGFVTLKRGKTLYQGKRVDCIQVCAVRKSKDDGVKLEPDND